MPRNRHQRLRRRCHINVYAREPAVPPDSGLLFAQQISHGTIIIGGHFEYCRRFPSSRIGKRLGRLTSNDIGRVSFSPLCGRQSEACIEGASTRWGGCRLLWQKMFRNLIGRHDGQATVSQEVVARSVSALRSFRPWAEVRICHRGRKPRYSAARGDGAVAASIHPTAFELLQ